MEKLGTGENKSKWSDYIVSLLLAVAIGLGICLVVGLVTLVPLMLLHPAPSNNPGLIIFTFIVLTGLISFVLFLKRDKNSNVLGLSLKLVILFWLICSIFFVFIGFSNENSQTIINGVSPVSTKPKLTSDQYIQQIGAYPKEYCTRTEPYPMDINFSNSIVYIQQNASKLQYFSAYLSDLNLIKNCLDITYASSEAEMNGANGLFFFSTPQSGKNHFKILISPSYKKSDLILNSYLLVHEITHAEQFIDTDIYNRVNSECTTQTDETTCKWLIPKTYELFGLTDCIGNEAVAWENQSFFLATIPGDTLGKLIVYSDYYNYDPQVAQAKNLFYFSANTVNSCMGNNKEACTVKAYRDFVSSIPAYQKECKITR